MCGVCAESVCGVCAFRVLCVVVCGVVWWCGGVGHAENPVCGGGGGGKGVPFSLFLSSLLFSLFSLPSFSFSSLFLFSLSSLVVSLSSLSNNDNDHSSSRALSLCAHTALTCQRVRVPVLWLELVCILFGRTCSYQKNVLPSCHLE